jgi:hypothetical protein
MWTAIEIQKVLGATLEVVEVLYDMGKLLLVLFSDRVLS